MAEWTVKYQAPKDKVVQTTTVNAPDSLKTAREVQTAIEQGEIPDLYIGPGAIVSVQKGGISFA
jgi:hypothetical protein